MDKRLVALEIRLTHHERMAEEMSDVLAEQQSTIDRLTVQVRRLTERMRDMTAADWSPSPQDDRPPPHY